MSTNSNFRKLNAGLASFIVAKENIKKEFSLAIALIAIIVVFALINAALIIITKR